MIKHTEIGASQYMPSIPRPPSINLLYYTMQALCVLSTFAQILIDASPSNLTSTLCAFAGTTFLTQYLIRSGCAHETPISAIALIGLNVTSLLTSMASMSAYWLPLTDKLRAPELTFFVLASIQVIAAVSHWIYRNFRPFSDSANFIARNGWRPLGAFSTPHISTIWLMGFIGAFSQIQGFANTGDVGGKTVQALGFLCWMPFLIPFYYAKVGTEFCNIKRQAPFILGFVFTMILVGMARNGRQIMMIGPLQLVLALFIYQSITKAPLTRNTVKRYVGGFLCLIALIGITSDLATAMAVAREKRDTSTQMEIVEETLQVLFFERHRLEDARMKSDLAAQMLVYDEAYIPNPILVRLSETKFHDNMLYFSDRYLADDSDALIAGMKGRALAILPETIAKLFDRQYDKNDYIFTVGDYYLYSLWGEQRLGSFVTGSIWADFYTLMGNWYPVGILPYLIITFIILDSLSLKGGSVSISAIAICTSWPIFIYGAGGESFIGKATLLLREIPQRILLYCFFLLIITWAQSLLGVKQPISQHAT